VIQFPSVNFLTDLLLYSLLLDYIPGKLYCCQVHSFIGVFTARAMKQFNSCEIYNSIFFFALESALKSKLPSGRTVPLSFQWTLVIVWGAFVGM